jgi:hypothetical protein
MIFDVAGAMEKGGLGLGGERLTMVLAGSVWGDE